MTYGNYMVDGASDHLEEIEERRERAEREWEHERKKVFLGNMEKEELLHPDNFIEDFEYSRRYGKTSANYYWLSPNEICVEIEYNGKTTDLEIKKLIRFAKLYNNLF